MLSFYLFFGILYALLLRGLGKFWGSGTVGTPKENIPLTATIVVAYRNEAGNLRTLLDSVLKQHYRPLELVLIDDYSEDGGAAIVSAYSEAFSEGEIILHSVKNGGIGKKAAIATGVEVALGEVILTTDADCELPDGWLEVMLVPFSEPDIHMVAGPVMSAAQNGFFQRFQQIEWASILLVTQAGFSLGNPIMCSAANLAFKKSSFFAVCGFQGNEQIPTGDDEFLLKKFVRQFGAKSIKYLPINLALITTRSHARWSELLSQRIRWASKWRMHGSPAHVVAAVFPAIVQLAWVGSALLLFQGWKGMLVFFLIWVLKIWYEKLALGKVLNGFSIAIPAHGFWITSIVHPWYVLGTAVGALFLNYTWKGRKFGVKQ